MHADLEILDRSPYVNLKTPVGVGADGDQSGSGYSHLPGGCGSVSCTHRYMIGCIQLLI